jgi:pimeloyl-ACP methyl ester carboxylesterase
MVPLWPFIQERGEKHMFMNRATTWQLLARYAAFLAIASVSHPAFAAQDKQLAPGVKEIHVEQCNGLTIHAWTAGDPTNPLVLLLHGMPETAYSWMSYLKPLSDAGYHVVAPDLRGYGYTRPIPEATETGENYATRALVADMVALTYRLGHDSCSVIGHDWGAGVAMACGTRRPDLFTSVGLISVPYIMSGLSDGSSGIARLKSRVPSGQTHYQQWFIDPRTAEDCAIHLESFLLSAYMAWGMPGVEHLRAPAPVFLPSELVEEHGARAYTSLFPPDIQIAKDTLAPAFSDDYLEYNFEAFRQSGFEGPLQYYKAIYYSTSRSESSQFANKTLEQPVLFIAGEHDAVIGPLMFKQQLDVMERSCPGLTKKVILEDASHWVHLERPQECLRHILEFEAKVWKRP